MLILWRRMERLGLMKSHSGIFVIPTFSLVSSLAQKQVFVNGEFGLYLPACPYDGVLGRTIKNHNIAGSMLWSLRYHSGAGGFYTHCEGYGHDRNGGGARDRSDYYYS